MDGTNASGSVGTADVPTLTAEEIRVLGCLIEKEATVPDSYPLTLNSLRTACNQSTSRDPVVEYGDHEIERALASLRERGLTRTVHSTSNRATKYRHVVPVVFELEPAETALLSVLMLRGPQTVGELKSRCERQHPFGSTEEVAASLAALAARNAPLVLRLERQPGQKDPRWVHLLAPPPDGDGGAADIASPEARPADHLTTVFDHGRLRIDLGPRHGDPAGNVDLRVTVRAERFGGTLTGILELSDLERFVRDLDAADAGRCRLGGGPAALVDLRSEPENGVGPDLSVECTIVRTEDDPQEWLQFLLSGVPPFAAGTASLVRAVLAEAGRHAADWVPGDRSG